MLSFCMYKSFFTLYWILTSYRPCFNFLFGIINILEFSTEKNWSSFSLSGRNKCTLIESILSKFGNLTITKSVFWVTTTFSFNFLPNFISFPKLLLFLESNFLFGYSTFHFLKSKYQFSIPILLIYKIYTKIKVIRFIYCLIRIIII